MRNLNSQILGVSHYFQGFIHPRWLFGIPEPSTVFRWIVLFICFYFHPIEWIYIYIYLDLPNMQNVLPLGRFFWWKGANVPHLEDPGIINFIYINAISITFNCNLFVVGFLRGGCSRGRGSWGTLRIPRKDWGTLGNIREDSGNHHPPLRILLFCWQTSPPWKPRSGKTSHCDSCSISVEKYLWDPFWDGTLAV